MTMNKYDPDLDFTKEEIDSIISVDSPYIADATGFPQTSFTLKDISQEIELPGQHSHGGLWFFLVVFSWLLGYFIGRFQNAN